MASVHFRDVSNEELINNTRALVRSATTLEVKLLYHLDEIRSRGIENCIKPSALLSVLQKKRRRLINERFKSQRIAAQQSRTSAAARQASLPLHNKSPAARRAAS